MASAPMLYRQDGAVDWGNMWDSFCILAQDGGPPHRPTLLQAQEEADTESAGYTFATAEITRGIYEVSGLTATAASPGWLRVECLDAAMAAWVSEAMVQENVIARHEGEAIFVPVGDYFSLEGEIKNVITAVAKTTHYWQDHMPSEAKIALKVQGWLTRQKEKFRSRGERV